MTGDSHHMSILKSMNIVNICRKDTVTDECPHTSILKSMNIVNICRKDTVTDDSHHTSKSMNIVKIINLCRKSRYITMSSTF